MPLYRLVLQRTVECDLVLNAEDWRDVTTKDFRAEYGLPEGGHHIKSDDPEPMTWHRVDQIRGGGAIVSRDTGWSVVLAHPSEAAT